MKDKDAAEMLQRTRRIETRLTQTMIALGITTEHQKPVFDPGSVTGDAKLTLPSPHSSMREALTSIPDAFEGAVEIYVGDQLLATIQKHSVAA